MCKYRQAQQKSPEKNNQKVWDLQDSSKGEDVESQSGIEEYEMESQMFDYHIV